MVENGLNGFDIVGRADERVSDEVDAEVNGIADVCDVAVGERRELYRDTGNVYALACAERAGVEGCGVDDAGVYAVDDEVELAVVDEEVVAGMNVVGYIGVGEADAFVGRE